jgi:hypothetical protein
MKWQWLAVCLVAATLLVSCETKKEVPPQEEQVIAATAKEELQKVDSALAKFEEALGAADLEATRTAARDLNRALSGLASHLAAKDMEAEQAAHKAGTEAPPAVMSGLRPALDAAGQVMEAVIPPRNDLARAQQLLPQIKSGVDAVRGSVE